MLTFRCAKMSLSRRLAPAGAALILGILSSVMARTPARAGTVVTDGCIGTWNTFSCVTRWGDVLDPYVRIVPQPLGDANRRHAAEQDRRWRSRCKPELVRDRYGIGRYQYAAPGCEFGVGED